MQVILSSYPVRWSFHSEGPCKGRVRGGNRLFIPSVYWHVQLKLCPLPSFWVNFTNAQDGEAPQWCSHLSVHTRHVKSRWSLRPLSLHGHLKRFPLLGDHLVCCQVICMTVAFLTLMTDVVCLGVAEGHMYILKKEKILFVQSCPTSLNLSVGSHYMVLLSQ